MELAYSLVFAFFRLTFCPHLSFVAQCRDFFLIAMRKPHKLCEMNAVCEISIRKDNLRVLAFDICNAIAIASASAATSDSSSASSYILTQGKNVEGKPNS